eukprot:c10307_g2_i1.p1 GENE.c10307_g2_i1~~c10307_g2_i1.p1  ORF type:complete len:352 (+),score=73.55 c10307_g2_i1:53-1057(+)
MSTSASASTTPSATQTSSSSSTLSRSVTRSPSISLSLSASTTVTASKTTSRTASPTASLSVGASRSSASSASATRSPSATVTPTVSASASPTPSSIRTRVEVEARFKGITVSSFLTSSVATAYTTSIASLAGVSVDSVIITGVYAITTKQDAGVRVTCDVLVAPMATVIEVTEVSQKLMDPEKLKESFNTELQKTDALVIVTAAKVVAVPVYVPSPSISVSLSTTSSETLSASTSPIASNLPKASTEQSSSSSSVDHTPIIAGVLGATGGTALAAVGLAYYTRRRNKVAKARLPVTTAHVALASHHIESAPIPSVEANTPNNWNLTTMASWTSE